MLFSPVSVIIPSYNRAHTLGRAIDSVLQQHQIPKQIIVIDDGSSDNTAELIKHSYPQVEYYYQENRGVSAARNLGIRAATETWIALLDSDDSWLNNKIATQFAALAQNDNHRLCHTEEIWIRNGVRVNAMNKHKKSGGWIFEKCLPMCCISPSASLIHHSVFSDIGLFDETLPACEDYDYWLRLCSQEAVAYCEDALINKYGGHEDQLSRHYWGMDRFRITALINLLEQTPLSDQQIQAARKTITKKARIMANGAEKRGNQQRTEKYRQIQHKYDLGSL